METIAVLKPDDKGHPSAEIRLERFANGYGFGMSVFTRTEGFSWLPHPNEDMYSTREEALKEALKELINKCRKLVDKGALKIIDNAINMMDDIEQPSLF